MSDRPQLLLVYSDSMYAVTCARYFRRQGWEVHLAATVKEAISRAPSLCPETVIVEMSTGRGKCESDQIAEAFPEAALVVLTPDRMEEEPTISQQGAAVFVSRRDGIPALAETVLANRVATTGYRAA